jgi:hypothetical protein
VCLGTLMVAVTVILGVEFRVDMANLICCRSGGEDRERKVARDN